MSFQDEVRAAIEKIQVPKTTESPSGYYEELRREASERHTAELKELWDLASATWGEEVGMLPLELKEWAFKGRNAHATDSKKQVPFIGLIHAITADGRTKSVEGFVVDDYFAFCAPGELRDFIPGDYFSTLASSFASIEVQKRLRRRIVTPEATPINQDNVRGTEFEITRFIDSENVGSTVSIRCSADGPSVVWMRTGLGDWNRIGGLREMIVNSLASAIAEQSRKQS